MINEEELSQIQFCLNLLYDEDAKVQSEIDPLTYLQTYANLDYLGAFHAILLTHHLPDQIYIFIFQSIQSIIMNNAQILNHNHYMQINSWFNEYILESAEFLFKRENGDLFQQFIECFSTLVSTGSKQFLFFQNFRSNLITTFPVHEYIDNPMILNIILSFLRRLVFSEDKQSDEFKTRPPFEYSLTILKELYVQFFQDHIISPDQNLIALTSLSMETISTYHSFLTIYDFILFLNYSFIFPQNEIPLLICEMCLKTEKNGNNTIPFYEVISSIENQFSDSLIRKSFEQPLLLTYFSSFILDFQKIGIVFSPVFLEIVEQLTVINMVTDTLFKNSSILQNFLQFFIHNTKNISQIQKPFLDMFFNAIKSDPKAFIEFINSNGIQENDLIVLSPKLFRNCFGSLIQFLKDQIQLNLQKSKDEIAMINVIFLIRILKEIFKYQIQHQHPSHIHELFYFIHDIQQNAVFPFLLSNSSGESKTEVIPFSEEELFAFLQFDYVSFESHEIFIAEAIDNSVDEHAFSQKEIDFYFHFLHLILVEYQHNPKLVQLSSNIIKNISEKTLRECPMDYNLEWMFASLNDFKLDYNLNFDSLSVFFEGLLYNLILNGEYDFVFYLHFLDESLQNIQKENICLFLSFYTGLIQSLKIMDSNQFDQSAFEYIHQNCLSLIIDFISQMQFGEQIEVYDQLTYDIYIYFLIFLIKLISIVRKHFFNTLSPGGTVLFNQIATVLIHISKVFIPRTISISHLNNEILPWQQKTVVTALYKKSFRIFSLILHLSSYLLDNDFVMFEAFVLYQDPIYETFMNTIFGFINIIPIDQILRSNEKLETFHTNVDFDHLFDHKNSYYLFIKSFFKNHIQIAYGDIQNSAGPYHYDFESFYTNSIINITQFESDNLIYLIDIMAVLISVLCNIHFTHDYSCKPYYIVSDDIDKIMRLIFQHWFIDNDEQLHKRNKEPNEQIEVNSSDEQDEISDEEDLEILFTQSNEERIDAQPHEIAINQHVETANEDNLGHFFTQLNQEQIGIETNEIVSDDGTTNEEDLEHFLNLPNEIDDNQHEETANEDDVFNQENEVEPNNQYDVTTNEEDAINHKNSEQIDTINQPYDETTNTENLEGVINQQNEDQNTQLQNEVDVSNQHDETPTEEDLEDVIDQNYQIRFTPQHNEVDPTDQLDETDKLLIRMFSQYSVLDTDFLFSFFEDIKRLAPLLKKQQIAQMLENMQISDKREPLDVERKLTEIRSILLKSNL